MLKNQLKKNRAFTLIELVVVLAIMGILTSIVLASTSGAHANARDERRIADLKEIQIDLAQYYEFHGNYPAALSDLSSFVLGGAGGIPTDPLSNQSYFYAPITGGGINASYCIGAELELEKPADNATAACAAAGVTNSSYDYMQEPPQ
jgi:prepilin-type N-terminal cleavage/methylation domain-containing protein